MSFNDSNNIGDSSVLDYCITFLIGLFMFSSLLITLIVFFLILGYYIEVLMFLIMVLIILGCVVILIRLIYQLGVNIRYYKGENNDASR